ncbi:MAG: molybdenum cofactor guanylyltransferase [Actinomycetota bacterium]
MEFDGVVLAGGTARRLGGEDKASLRIGGRSLLDRAVDALDDAGRVIVVGPRRSTLRSVSWARESPVGAGPLAATAAGVEHVIAESIVVLAVDYPFVDANVVAALLSAMEEHDGAALTDDEGNFHYVAGAYQTASVRRTLERRGRDQDASMRGVFASLDVVAVHDDRAALDIDYPEDLEAARRIADS